MSQSRIVPSKLPERSCLPLGEIATRRMSLVCPRNLRTSFPVVKSQSWRDASTAPFSSKELPPPVIACLPSAVKATVQARPPFWTSRLRNSLPVSTSHERAMPSLQADRACLPSGEKATSQTVWPCPANDRSSLPVSRSQARIVRSPLPVRARLPSADMATLLISPWCPLISRKSSPFSRFQYRSALSQQAESARLPSALMATPLT